RREADRDDEFVAATGNRDDVAVAALAVAQGTAQRRDLDLEVAFLDEDLRPDPGDQLFLRNHPAGVVGKNGENVQGAATEAHRLTAFEQQPLAWQQAERAQRNRAFSRPAGCPRWLNFLLVPELSQQDSALIHSQPDASQFG